MKNLIKKFIPEDFKKEIRTLKLKKYYKKRFLNLKRADNKNIILIGTPEYCNLGDTALALCELKFFEEYFEEYNIVEITDRLYKYEHKNILKFITPDDILFITGGGFLGNLWMDGENLVRDVIRNFSSNKIAIFPQTMFFEKDISGIKELKKTITYWESAKDLLVMTREENSYNFINNNFSNQKVRLYPDMVLSGMNVKKCDRENVVLLCLRNDKERVLSKEVSDKIKQILDKRPEMRIQEIDTIVWDGFSYESREKILYNLLQQFSKSKLVITDKLHGMIFAIVTGTPCVVFDNKTRKISGVYKWVEKLPYIKMVYEKNFEKVLLEFLNDTKTYIYDTALLKKEFDNMAATVQKWIKREEVKDE